MTKSPGFISRWLVTIVMLPSLALIHVGWKKLQDVESLVKPEERNELYPHVALYHKLDEKIKKFIHQPD